MSYRPLGDDKWIADVSCKGMGRHTKVCDTEDEAAAAERALKMQYGGSAQRLALMESGVPTLREYTELVYWPMKAQLRTSTVATYKRSLNRYVFPVLGDMRINEITPVNIQMMINATKSKRAGQLAREALSSILGTAVDGIAMRWNPASYHYNYPPKNLRDSRAGEVLPTFEEHGKLLRYVRKLFDGETVERLVVLGLCFGLRPEEVWGLDWENVILKERVIYIDQIVSAAGGSHLERTKTEKGTRYVPMSEYAYERLSAWGQTDVVSQDLYGEDAHPVATNSAGKRLSCRTGQKRILALTSMASPDDYRIPRITQHSLRHSFATAVVNKGEMDVNTLADILGHVDPSTTRRRYVKPQLEDKKRAMAGITY